MSRNILIDPQRTGTGNPSIQFSGSSANLLKLDVLPNGSVQFSGTLGQIVSFTDTITGSIFGNNVYVSGTIIAASGITGSITKLSDGTSFITAGSNVTITTGSNGSITISSTGGGGSSGSISGDPDAMYLVLANTSSLSNERAFGVGTGINRLDFGANSSYLISIDDNVVATVSGTMFTGVTKHNAGLSGSLTRLVDGTSYIIAGSNVSVASGSNGSITISATPTGSNAYTSTTASFIQPSINSTVTISVLSTGWMAANEYVFVEGAGHYQVTAVNSTISTTIRFLGGFGNDSPPNTVVASGKLVTPTGAPGNAYMLTSADFQVPAVDATVVVPYVPTNQFLYVGETVWLHDIYGDGWKQPYEVTAFDVGTEEVTLKNSTFFGTISPSPGETFLLGTRIYPAGAISGSVGGSVDIPTNIVSMPMMAGVRSTYFSSAAKQSIGCIYFDPANNGTGTRTYRFRAILESTSTSYSASLDLYDINGIVTGTPAVISNSPMSSSALTPTQVSSTVVLSSVTGSGIIEARLWLSPSLSTEQASCKGAWLDILW